jgi:dolichyl-diphosphooligosaccharide--protein glycosyltransferase
MIFATVQHIHWKYYVAVNINYLAAMFIGWTITFVENVPEKCEKRQ